MPNNLGGRAVVIMGVSGAGKSTIGEMLARVLGCDFLDADDFHPNANKEKMSQGIPLSDDDRIPWLETQRDLLQEYLIRGKTVVLGCSALKKQYREILRSSEPGYRPGIDNERVKFALLDGKAEIIAARLEKRATDGKHFMPAKLLQSQLDTLQVEDCEKILRVDVAQSPEDIVSTLQSAIFT